jgi:hypothetical protein
VGVLVFDELPKLGKIAVSSDKSRQKAFCSGIGYKFLPQKHVMIVICASARGFRNEHILKVLGTFKRTVQLFDHCSFLWTTFLNITLKAAAVKPSAAFTCYWSAKVGHEHSSLGLAERK